MSTGEGDGVAPVATVVIPVYNAAETLGEQLDALSRQEAAPAFEVVVADNGSTDDTRAVAEAWVDRVPGLEIVDASARRGPCAARNIGAATTASPHLLFCDADDVAGPNWVAGMVDGLDRHDIVGGRLLDDALNDEVVRSWYAGTPDGLLAKYRDFLLYASGASMGIRRSVFDAIGGWDEEFQNATDADICFRAQLDVGATIGFAAEATMQYRYRSTIVEMQRQMRNYGRADAQLWARYRDRGMVRSRWRTVRQWMWLVVHLPDLARSVERRGRWRRQANIEMGRLEARLRRNSGRQ